MATEADDVGEGHGKVLFTSETLKPDLSAEAKTNAAWPGERWGDTGKFVGSGPATLAGGKPRDVPLEKEPGHGTVMFTSQTLKPDLSAEGKTNAAWPGERWGNTGQFEHGDSTVLAGGKPRDIPLGKDVNHGKVLYTSETLAPDLKTEGPRTNDAGGRPDERWGTKSFDHRHPVLAGGQPHDVAPDDLLRELDHGKVLHESCGGLVPDLTSEGKTNAAWPGERWGDTGGFVHGSVEVEGGPLQMQPRGAAEEWGEPGQRENKFRRGTASHYLAGTTILKGGPPPPYASSSGLG